MPVKMDFKSKHFEKMESLVMKENHLRVTYGGTSVTVLTARKESLEEDRPKRKKKSSQQKLKERYEAEDPEVDLLGEPSGRFDYYVLYPRSKKQTLPSLSKKDYNQNQKPPLIPYYQKL